MLHRGPSGDYVSLDTHLRLRFWAAAWSELVNVGLARSTQWTRLTHVDALYSHVDSIHGDGALDDALNTVDVGRVQSYLEAFLVSLQLRSQDAPPGREFKWKTAYSFIQWVLLALGGSQPDIDDLERRVRQLHQLYGSLRPRRHLPVYVNRTVPSAVLEELWELVNPESRTNPFKDEAIRWRNFVAFSVLLLLGLRAGELLSMPTDGIKSEQPRDGRRRHWVNVQYNPYEDDPRTVPASIKTSQSVRQLPISDEMHAIVENYVANYRGRRDSSFLILNRYGEPLTVRGLRKVFGQLTSSLSKSARQLLKDRTGMDWLSPHDLRHTCAAFRMQHLIQAGKAVDEATQLMRAFFGWSHDSQMPRLYARTAFESKLNSMMDEHFSSRVVALKNFGALA